MKTSVTFKYKRKDAFVLMLVSENMGHGVFQHDLISNLPEECLRFCNSSYLVRLTPEYLPNEHEVKFMLRKLGSEILSHEQLSPLFFPDYLLMGNSMDRELLQMLLKVQQGFLLKPGEHFSENTNSLQFASLTRELMRFKIFSRSKFRKRFLKISRKRFEDNLKPGRATLDYIELHRDSNEFYNLSQEKMTFYFLCNESQYPKMVIGIGKT